MSKKAIKNQSAGDSTQKMALASDSGELSGTDLESVSGGDRGRFNESQTLASSVQKKLQDTGNAVIQKI